MRLTAKLKTWLVENHGVDKDASDDEFRAAAGKAMFSEGEKQLTTERLEELTKSEQDAQAGLLHKSLETLANGIEQLVKLQTGGKAVGGDGASATGDEPEGEKETVVETKDAPTTTKERKATELETKLVSIHNSGGGDSKGEPRFRVKEAVDQYDNTKSALRYPDQRETKSGTGPHPMAGRQVKDFGRALDTPTDRDKALAGVWAKYQLYAVTPRIAGNPKAAWEMLTDHEKSLLGYLAEDAQWDDSKESSTGESRLRSCKGYRSNNGGARGIKALIDDATSGGLEAAPIVFDDMVIQTPLLHGELFPLVNTIPLDRGRRVEGVATGTVTGSWGGVDDTAVTLFTTTSYVSAFDTTIFRWEGAIRIGLDFVSDTPIDFGAHITAQYGERLLEDLDDVIAAGNGSTQPEGIINKTGGTSVNFGSSESLALYEQMRFGVAKAEFRPNVAGSAVFCGTETSYRRARALPVGSSDARRLGGMDYDSYKWMEHPFKINESLSNAQIFFAIMARYRMYRRRGLTVRTSTEGDTLLRNNEMLIVAMARYGGQLERGACFAYTTTATA